MNGSKIKVIFFDYYGTLVHMKQPFIKLKEWFSITHIKGQSKVTVNEFFMFFSRQRANLLFSHEFLTGYQTLVRSYQKTCIKFQISPDELGFRSYTEYLFSNTTVYDDALLTLEKLRHKFTIGLLTNADNDLLKESMKKHGIFVNYLITSEDARCNKPSEGIFLNAIKAVKVKPEQILMIGDSITDDIIPAQNMGFSTIWINRDNQKGIDEKQMQIKELKEVLQIFNL